MNKTELYQKCKDLGFKGISSKTKSELQELLDNYIVNHSENINTVCTTGVTLNSPEVGLEFSVIGTQTNILNNTNPLQNVLDELQKKVPRDKTRKVCKQCNEIGHNSTSIDCKVNIKENIKLQNKIKENICLYNYLDDNKDKMFEDLSIKLNITSNRCKTLYNEIDIIDVLNYQLVDIDTYLESIKLNCLHCSDCNIEIYNMQSNTLRKWKSNVLCDKCWIKYEPERNILWECINNYKLVQCAICMQIRTHENERFHYDHLNMFDKEKSICSMVNDGYEIDDIYKEIDKCQILCISCHHKITDIERKLGFIRAKQTLTRKQTAGQLPQDEYDKQTKHLQSLYNDKMLLIYNKLKNKN